MVSLLFLLKLYISAVPLQRRRRKATVCFKQGYTLALLNKRRFSFNDVLMCEADRKWVTAHVFLTISSDYKLMLSNTGYKQKIADKLTV